MSEILITGIEMPNDGQTLHLGVTSDGRIATISGCKIKSKAIELPTHGRLGDLDALAEYIKNVYCKDCKRSKVMCKACEYGDIIDEIEDAPTIIEASTEEKSNGSDC